MPGVNGDGYVDGVCAICNVPMGRGHSFELHHGETNPATVGSIRPRRGVKTVKTIVAVPRTVRSDWNERDEGDE